MIRNGLACVAGGGEVRAGRAGGAWRQLQEGQEHSSRAVSEGGVGKQLSHCCGVSRECGRGVATAEQGHGTGAAVKQQSGGSEGG